MSPSEWGTSHGRVWLHSVAPVAPTTIAEKLQAKLYDAALVQAREALDAHPESADAFCAMGQCCQALGRLDQAIQAFGQAHAIDASNSDYALRYARVLRTVGRFDGAVGVLKSVSATGLSQAKIELELARIHRDAGPVHLAQLHARAAVELNPNDPDCRNVLGNALVAMADYAGAKVHYQAALEADDSRTDIAANLANILRISGSGSDALAVLDRYKDSAHLRWRIEYAGALNEVSRPEEGAKLLRQLLEDHPGEVGALLMLADIYRERGALHQAAKLYRRVLDEEPAHWTAMHNLAITLQDQGRNALARTLFTKVAEGATAGQTALNAKSALLLLENYEGDLSRDTVFELHRSWGLEAKKLATIARGNASSSKPRRSGKIALARVGILSPDLRFHPIAFFVEPLLRYLKSTGVALTAYYSRAGRDSTSDRLHSYFAQWHHVHDANDADLARQVIADEMDVLIDLSGHTGGHRLGAMAVRCAPQQVSWLGYPNGTGVDTIDLRISDRWLDSEPDADRYYVETLARLDPGFCVYEPPQDAPRVAPLPPGPVRIGCINNPAKLGRGTIRLLAETLHAVPDSVLVLQAFAFLDEFTVTRIKRLMQRMGIHSGRIECHPPTAFDEHLTLHGGCHIAIDSIPWTGHTTTCHALWMGVPVVTVAGDHPCARMGVSVVHRAGYPELVSDSIEDMPRRVCEILNGRLDLVDFRARIREAMRHSPLMDERGFGEAFVAALQTAH
jgi:protein O-GlcNAc transferase